VAIIVAKRAIINRSLLNARDRSAVSTSRSNGFGGLVKEENIIFTLDSRNSKIAVAAVFDNGYVSWINFYPLSGSMIYAKQPSTNAIGESKSYFRDTKPSLTTTG
jgi:hypothetical protein